MKDIKINNIQSRRLDNEKQRKEFNNIYDKTIRLKPKEFEGL